VERGLVVGLAVGSLAAVEMAVADWAVEVMGVVLVAVVVRAVGFVVAAMAAVACWVVVSTGASLVVVSRGVVRVGPGVG